MYMYFKASAILYGLSAIAILIFALGVYDNLLLIVKGKAPSFHQKFNKVNALKALFYDVCLQRQILKQSSLRWIMHIFLFYGFLGLFLHTAILFLLSHFVPEKASFSYFFYHGSGKALLDLWGDLFGTILLVGTIIAVLRRYLFKVKQIDTIVHDTIAILLLLLVVLTGFISEAFRLVQSPYLPDTGYSFLGFLFSLPLRVMHLPLINYKLFQVLVLWGHIIVSLIFIAYIPFSKMWHLFASPIEILINASEEASRKNIYGR